MYTQEQILELLKNKNVIKCSKKSIGYAPKFKLWAVKKYYEEGYSSSMIFKKAGFDLNVIGKNKADDRLVLWRKIYNERGEKGLLEENRGKSSSGGGRPTKIKFKNDKEKIRYLEAKIAYMDA